MVCVSFKFIFVCYFIVALSQFGSAQSEPGLWASIATRINTWTFALVDLVAPSFARTVGAEQSETTKALCKRNTVKKCIELGRFRHAINLSLPTNPLVLLELRFK